MSYNKKLVGANLLFKFLFIIGIASIFAIGLSFTNKAKADSSGTVYQYAAVSSNCGYAPGTSPSCLVQDYNDTLMIFSCSSLPCTPDPLDSEPFYPQQQTGNEVSWIGQESGAGTAPITITVANACSAGTASQATMDDGGTKSTISVSGYAAAVKGINQPGAPGSDPIGGGSATGGTGEPECGSNQSLPGPQTVTVAVNIQVPGSDVNQGQINLGPLTFLVSPSTNRNDNVATLTTPATAITGSQTTVTTNTSSTLPAGNYLICTSDMSINNSPAGAPTNCMSLTPASFENGAITVNVTGVSNGQTNFTNTIGDGGENPASCEGSNWELDWIICPIVDKLSSAADALDNIIDQLLTVKVSTYFSDNTGCTAGPNSSTTSCSASTDNYALWANLRDLALSLLVIAALIMVISQALDFGPFDAYTIKKMLPKILLAVILISFSWELGRLLVQFSDDLGAGVRSLILDIDKNSLNVAQPGGGIINVTQGGLLTAFGLLGTVAGGAVLFGAFAIAAGPMAVFLLLVSIMVSLVVGFLILVFRQLLIIVCVVSAPLAFIAFIMPGGQRIWKLWRDSFMGALLMFPMITGVIALGTLLGAIEYVNPIYGHAFGAIATLIALVLAFGPYFLLPSIAKRSMGAMGMITGALGNLSKSLRAPLQKARQENSAKNRQKIMAGQKSQRTFFGKGLNRVGMGIGLGWKGKGGFGRTGKQAADIRNRMQQAEAARDPAMTQLGFDDDGILAMFLSAGDSSGKTGTEELRKLFKNKDGTINEERVQNAMASARAVGITQANSMAAGTIGAANKFRSLEGGQAGIDAISRASERLGHGNQTLADNLKGNFQFYARQNGRTDLGAGSLGAAWSRASMGMLAGNTGTATRAHVTDILERLHSEDAATRGEAAIQVSEMRALLPNTSAENQGIINDMLTEVGTTDQALVNYVNRYGGININGTDSRFGKESVRTVAGNISGMARKYGGEVPEGARDPHETPSAQVPGANGEGHEG